MTTTIIDKAKLKAYWREQAGSFPRPSREAERVKSLQIIEHVKALGVTVAGTDILEIGCGTGLMTIPLAHAARHVTACDFCPEMLAILKEEIARAGIANIQPRQCSWQTFDPVAEGLVRSWDSVWAVRSTAVSNAEDLEKMERCARTWCVLAGADTIRRSPVVEAILAFHGVPPILFPGASGLLEMLEQRGRGPTRDTVSLIWERVCPVEQALQQIIRHIELLDITPQRKMIAEALAIHSPEGLVRLRNRVDLGLVVWRVDR